MDLLRSPLHERHLDLSAKFGEFGGWSMPLEYAGDATRKGGVLAEHAAVREAAGLFDVSHLGKAMVRGGGAVDFVNACFTNDLRRIGPGQAQYTLCCDENGGTVDDLIAYVRSEFDVFLIPNAANTAEVVRRLAEAAPDGIEITSLHREYAVLALQGPASDEILRACGVPTDHDYMSFVETQLDDAEVIVCRTGYTGERGYELVVPAQYATAVWDDLLRHGRSLGLVPAGLGARDTLRTEMGYPLHGHELSADISPVMARAGWAIGWDKESFWGKDALVAQREAKDGPLLRGLRATGRGIPRPGMTVASLDGRSLGQITSGTFSPTLRQGIALALLDRSVGEGDTVHVEVRGTAQEFEVVRPPFVATSTRA